MTGRFLPGVPGSEIEAIFEAAPGNEIGTGKFDNPESSAALAANAFGFFLNRASDLPALPGCEGESWPAHSIGLESEIRFPWRGGRHPILDCLVETPSALIGIESKRFEPYRSKFHPEASNLAAAQDGELIVVPRTTWTPISMPTSSVHLIRAGSEDSRTR